MQTIFICNIIYVWTQNYFILNIYKYISTLCLSFYFKKAKKVKFKQNYITKKLRLINNINGRDGGQETLIAETLL